MTDTTNTINFERLARQIQSLVEAGPPISDTKEIADILRLVWNARGVVDIAKLEQELAVLLDPANGSTQLSAIKRMLQALDQ